MSREYYFVIVGHKDQPLYEIDFPITNEKKKRDDTRHLNQFIAHAALDIVDEQTIDKFNEWFVSAFVTAGGIRFIMLHTSKNEEGIRQFFQEMYETFIKLSMNPFHVFDAPIQSANFDQKTTLYGTNVTGNEHRRTWNTAAYSAKAIERLQTEKLTLPELKGPKAKRENLKARDYKVDLESKVGRSVVVSKVTPSAESGGYYCDVCDCVIKDSINFLDHINGKNHQRNMGMNMKVERSTLDDVKARFAFKKQEMLKKKREQNIEETLKEVKEEEAKMADHAKFDQPSRKKKRTESHPADSTGDDLDPEMAAMMGFGGFSTSKRK